MANVTIKLTVDTAAILNSPKNPNLGTNCRLSQSGGEDIGNYMVVDPVDSEQNISYVSESDVITWVGIPADGEAGNLINITLIQKDPVIGGGSVLGDALSASWTYGGTVIRQVVPSSTHGNIESYHIEFNINGGSTYKFDPKIQVHQP